jgi:AcrR family transcriptional regulator
MSAAVPSGWDRRRNLLLGQYERIALEQFASRGFKAVTVDEIADAAGVSARTLFRYFPAKEDVLVGYPRRATAAEVELIAALDPSRSPLESVWSLIRDLLTQNPPDVELLNLWRRAAADAPEVVDRVRGERTQALLDAVTAYCARSLGVDAATDPRPRVLAGIVVGVELAVIESIGRLDSTLTEIVDAAERSIGVLGQAAITGAP